MAPEETNRLTATADRPKPSPYPADYPAPKLWSEQPDPVTNPQFVPAPVHTGNEGGWLSFGETPAPVTPGFTGTGGTQRRKGIATAAALLLVGALCGALITLALRGSSTSNTAAQGFGGPGGTAGAAGQFPGGTVTTGVTGTITSVSSSSISVSATTGTVTYAITNSTRIMQGTAPVAVSALKVGEQVTVTPAASASSAAASTSRTAATIVVGAAASATTNGTGTTGTGTTGSGTTGTATAPTGTVGQPPAGTTGQPPAGAPAGLAPAA